MHYQGLLGYKADADFAPGTAAPLVSDRAGDNRLPEEIHQQEQLKSANESQDQASYWNMAANAIHYAVPDFSIGTPQCSTTYGGSNNRRGAYRDEPFLRQFRGERYIRRQQCRP